MSRRIDIELTSTRDDGSWTWRAAGAKQPKGSLDGTLLPGGASVGDVLRAEVETTLDGTSVLSVAAPKERARQEPERIELIGRTLRDDELVIETRARRGRRDRGDRDDRGDRRRGRDGERRPRRDGDRRDRGERGDRGPRGDRDRGSRGDRPQGERRDRPRRDRPAPPPKPKAKRLRAGRTHRKAALAALAPEEQVIAEQVLQGGIPAVRQAVEKMNEQARAEGRPEVKPDALVAVAERLLPALRTAEWRDRADAAVADLDELDLRDLRSVVVAADQAAKDDEARAIAATLREGLGRRVEGEQAKWLAEIAENLDDGRVVRALRLSSRPPKAGAPLPGDLATRLAEATAASLTADTLTDRWATVLDALSFSPVRLTVTPASKPDAPSEELLAAVTRVAARLPQIAAVFGIEAPAEAPRRRGGRGGGGRRSGGGAKPGGAPKPPAARPAATDRAPAEAATPTGESATPEAPAAAPVEAPAPEAADAAAEPVASGEAPAEVEAPAPVGSAAESDEAPAASEPAAPADAGSTDGADAPVEVEADPAAAVEVEGDAASDATDDDD